MTTVDAADIEVIRRILYTQTGYLGADDTPVEAFHRLLAELYVARSRALPQLPRNWIIRKLEDFGSYATCELHELDDAGRESKAEGQTIFAAIEAAVANIGLMKRKPVALKAKKNASRRRRSKSGLA
jgi:hypothetical protein